MIHFRLPSISLVTLLAFVLVPAAIDAKRTKRVLPSLKIVAVTTSPVPFSPGNGPMAITVDVELPRNLSRFDVLEVASLISVPSRRSIRFLVSRQDLETVAIADRTPRVKTTLLWDGKDQTREYVRQGTYSYEVRAKLMVRDEGFARTKVVSRFARGTLEVSSPQPLVRRHANFERVPVVSDDTGSEPPDKEGSDASGRLGNVRTAEDVDQRDPE